MKSINRTSSKSRLQRYLLPSLHGRGRGVGLLLLLAGFLFCACDNESENGDENGASTKKTTYTVTSQSEAPVWQMDWTGNQERPDWQEPDPSSFENFEILMVQIEEALQSYVSAEDRMAIFINGELRGLASPAVSIDDGTVFPKFLMKAYYNEAGTETVDISLQYYCQQLKHLFTLTDHLRLDADIAIGIGQDYIPEFTLGSAKYPVVKTVSVEALLSRAGLTPFEGNVLAAFVGEECRGTTTLSADGNTTMHIYGRAAGETATLKYYDAISGQLYTLRDVVKI